jgi:hypothetical protein
MKRIFIPPHPDDACPRKVRYATEIAARMGAQATITSLDPAVRKRGLERLWVYQCPVCSGWHLTRNESREGNPAVTKRELSESASVAAARQGQDAQRLGAQPGRTAAQPRRTAYFAQQFPCERKE